MNGISGLVQLILGMKGVSDRRVWPVDYDATEEGKKWMAELTDLAKVGGERREKREERREKREERRGEEVDGRAH